MGGANLRAMASSLATTDPQRSALMSRVRQKGTAPELGVRAQLSGLGAHYRLNVRSLPGSPDIANKGARKAIFVHGCFWHRHEGCARTTTPKRNREFWVKKFLRNQQRDATKTVALEELGYDVLIVWECELVNPRELKRKLSRFWMRRRAG